MTVHFDGTPDEFERLLKVVLSPLASQLDTIAEKLDAILKGESELNLDFSKLQTAVANETTVDQSAVTLINGIAAEVADLKKQIAGLDPTAAQAVIDQFVSTLTGNTATLASAVSANTIPAPAPSPAPAPAPSAP